MSKVKSLDILNVMHSCHIFNHWLA